MDLIKGNERERDKGRLEDKSILLKKWINNRFNINLNLTCSIGI